MGRSKNRLAFMAMLSGIVVLASVGGLTGSSSRPAPTPAPTQVALNTPLMSDQTVTTAPDLLTQNQPTEQRVSVSFNDDASSSYALLKRMAPTDKTIGRPAVDVWYGQYFSAQDYSVLPASPVEKEPSRLCLKISFAF